MKWFIILLVVLFHVISVFSSCKGLMSINEPGIPALDSIGYMIYPWFMSCLFIAAGVSAKYALEKIDKRSFIRARMRKLLIPLISYTFLIGPFAANLSFQVNYLEEQLSKLPPFVIMLIKLVSGMGPSWFLLQLFLVSLVLLLVLKLDKNQNLMKLGAKCTLPVLLLFYIPVFLSAQILFVTYTYRNMLYLLMFLMGYYIFSQDNVIARLKKHALRLLCFGIGLGALQTYHCWGTFYQGVVNDWLVMLYTWIMVLAVFGCFARYFDWQNKFNSHMTDLSFGIYLFHYVPLIYISYILSTQCTLPYALNYFLAFTGTIGAAIILTWIAKKIPVVNLLFGLKRSKRGKDISLVPGSKER